MNNEAYIEKMNIHWSNFLEEGKTNVHTANIGFIEWYADKLRSLKTPDEIDAFINHPKPIGMNNEVGYTGETPDQSTKPLLHHQKIKLWKAN